jgi:hypothetical protein
MASPPPIGIYVRVSRVGKREGESFTSPRDQAARAEVLVRAAGRVPGEI